MYTSVRSQHEASFLLTRNYLLLTAFTALFGAVYECFSHGVFSFFMLYAFTFPLAGALFFLILQKREKQIPAFTADCIHSGLAVLTTGCLVTGALRIYGTDSTLLCIYWIAGVLLLGIAFVSFLFSRRKNTVCH